ncbi:PilZ domain-containing protein [Rheinheimera sp.]|uniref:PilZ domain-containing protein n=1 Tax=Rheinheimera sp. TaxID=1869214 RepID=UPI00307EB024
MDHRRFSRVLFSGPTLLTASGQQLPGQLKDLSLKGALVQLEHTGSLVIGTPYQLEIELNDSGLHLQMQVSVAHQHGLLVGLRCDKVDIESVSHLRRLLELNLGDAELLSRELADLSAP